MIKEEGIFDFCGRRIGKELLYSFEDKILENHKEYLFESFPEVIDIELFEYHISSIPPSTNELYFINLKPSTILKFYNKIESILFKHRVPRNKIVVEIREDFISNGELTKISEISKKLGFSICIDDFGKGASNFERILSIKPSFIKVDVILFPKDILELIVKSIRKSSYAKLIAEKVESKELFILSKRLNFDYWQGFFEFSKKYKEISI